MRSDDRPRDGSDEVSDRLGMGSFGTFSAALHVPKPFRSTRQRFFTSIDRLCRRGFFKDVFIERLWRSLKQEAIYLEEITDGFQARRVIKNWMKFYNAERPHSALDRLTPDDAYWAGLDKQKAA